MKRFLLLFLLLPVLGFAQTDIVKWNGPSVFDATVYNANAESAPISGNGVNFQFLNYVGFTGTQWPTGSSIDPAKYIQISVKAKTGFKVNLATLNFAYNPYDGSSGPRKYQIRYSTNAAFPSNGTLLLDEQNAAMVKTNVSVNFPANTSISNGQTMYIRFYAYDRGNTGWDGPRWGLLSSHADSNTGGAYNVPTIRGTVGSLTLGAVNDAVSVIKNVTKDIDVLSNDSAGLNPITSVVIASQPTNGAGTVSVNPDKTIRFIPANNYTGTSSFTYTISDGSTSSTATVSLSISAGTPTGALCGTYLIGSVPQLEHPQFTTITSAINYLNTNGISCAVTFLLDNTTYNAASGETFPLTINPIAASSSTNTVTFKPNTGKTVTVTGNIGNGSTAAIIKINGADYVTFDGSNNGTATRNLKIVNESNLNYDNAEEVHSTIIWIGSNGSNPSTYNTIKNIEFVGINISPVSSTTAGIVFSSGTNMNTVENVSNSFNLIHNNSFSKMKYGVFVRGNASVTNKNLTISSNIFGSTTSSQVMVVSAIRSANIENATFTGNSILGVLTSSQSFTTSGITMSGKAINSIISYNRLSNIRNSGSGYARGIYLDLDTSVANNISLINNFVRGVSSSRNDSYDYNNAGHGIYINNGKKINVYFNTVNLDVNQYNLSSALFVANGTELNVRNNIFSNKSTSGREYAIYLSVDISAFAITDASNFLSNLDYNDYYSTQYLGYFSGDRTNITNWKAAVSNRDYHSISVEPTFLASTSDLFIDPLNALNLSDLDGRGLPISGITTDIEYDIRNTAAPDMGADEFGPKCSGIATQWNNPGVWTNGIPDSTKKATINFNYTATVANSFTACELVVNNGYVLKINPEAYIKVENGIITTGSIVVENNASLIQVDNDASLTSPGLNVTVKRTSTGLKQFDYTYWSSPVVGATLSTVSNPSIYYQFDPLSGSVGNWSSLNGSAIMEPGAGYIARAPNDLDFTAEPAPTVTATFVGKANSGTITKKIYKNEEDTSISNLVGNPYPSALNADKFILENQANIGGTLYFWTHFTKISNASGNNNAQNYTTEDYAVYNLSGSTGTRGNISETNEVGANRPTGEIASGQAFFVDALKNDVNITFNNLMRTGGANTQFFRGIPQRTQSGPIEKSRVWVNISNEEGAYAEILVGYIDGATNDFDNLFDANKLDGGNYVSLYSILDQKNLVIQGRALPFSDSDSIPLGYNSTIAGTFTIALDQFDGLFNNQDVFLLDKLSDTSTNLNEGGYTFTSAIGTFDDRFELRYTNATLGVTNPVTENATVIFAKDNHVEIVSPNQDIQSIMIYDLLGRRIYSQDTIKSRNFSTAELGLHNQVIIVKVKTDNAIITKKIILN